MVAGQGPEGGVRHVRSSWVPRRLGRALLVVLAIAAAGASANAQNAYYDKPDGALQTRVTAWSDAYWARVDAAGTPVPNAAAAAFSGLVANPDLFNPVRAARWTLEDIKILPTTDCDMMEVWPAVGLQTGGAVPGSTRWTIADAFRDAMKHQRFSTDIGLNPEGTQEHAGLILAAPPSVGVVAYQDGDKLVSLNLPLKTVSAMASNAALALNLSQESQLVLATMIASSHGWATASADKATEAESLITGAQSKADRFAEIVRNFLSLAEVQGRAVGKLQAHFGLCGQLPIIQVNLSDCTVLMDPLSGNVSGPFMLNSALDARGLLGYYSGAYVAGSGVRYFTSGTGCPTLSAAQLCWPNSSVVQTRTNISPGTPTVTGKCYYTATCTRTTIETDAFCNVTIRTSESYCDFSLPQVSPGICP